MNPMIASTSHWDYPANSLIGEKPDNTVLRGSAASTYLRNWTITVALLVGLSVAPFTSSYAAMPKFCKDPSHTIFAEFKKHASSNDWFEVYEVGLGIWAILEPFQWQQVISYLIVGTDKALLFDTGNGIGNIKLIVDQLTDKPVLVLNSHSHFDHIGGNHLFDRVLSVATAFSISHSKGLETKEIALEASPEALCHGLPDGVTQNSHRIRPYAITDKVKDGDVIDLGNRQLEILLIPGHTDDSIALMDRQSGLLWPGDSFYEGPIWLFFPETDLNAYGNSIARLAALAPQLKNLFPSHKIPRASPALLVEAQRAFKFVLEGKAKAVPARPGLVRFEFEGFSFLMREN